MSETPKAPAGSSQIVPPPSGVSPVVSQMKDLRSGLYANLAIAELDLNRMKTQVADLQFATQLVDGALELIGKGTPPNQAVFQNTVINSGVLAQEASANYAATANIAERSLYSTQIQNTLVAGVSAYLADFNGKLTAELVPLAKRLSDHRAELLTLEQRLSAKLKDRSAHLQQILQGALDSYRDAKNPLRFTNSANGLRELMREFLALTAPDADLKKASWFVPDETSDTGVTRAHRLRYAIYGALPKESYSSKFVAEADKIGKELLGLIGKLSKYTHVTAEILDKQEADAAPILAGVLQRFLQLIEAVRTGRDLVMDGLTVEIQERLDYLFREYTFDELDTLSTHTRPDFPENIEVKIERFDNEWIYFTGTGIINVDLQYGSDGDVDRGDGLECSDAYPFKFAGKAPTSDPEKIEIDGRSVDVDTSSFYE